MTSESPAGDEMRTAGEPGMGRIGVGVVGVLPEHGRATADRDARSCWAAMENYTALLNERTALHALPLPLTRVETSAITERLLELPESVAAVFILGLGPSEAPALQLAAACTGGPLVVTESDALTVALAAAAVTTLWRRLLGPRRGRVAVLGAETAPKLEAVLLRSGAGSVCNWFDCDAPDAPSERVLKHYDAVVDLTGTMPQDTAPGRLVRIPSDRFAFASLPLPGLLSALCGHGAGELTVDALAAAARGLALATPTGRTTPDLDHRHLAFSVARQVTRIFTDPSASHSHWRH